MLELDDMIEEARQTKSVKAMESIAPSLHKLPQDEQRKLAKKMFYHIHDGHFDEKLAKYAVHKMHNVDGTTGERVSMDEVKKIMEQCKITCNMYDFYYIINMAYSDYAKVFGTNANLYINWTLAYMQDPDAKSGKALRQYFREQEDY